MILNYRASRVLLASVLSAAAFLAQPSQAQLTWSGLGADANWSTPANWAGVAPVDGDALIFAGSTQLVNTNDLVLASNAWVRFDAGGFVLRGNTLSPAQGITNSVGVNQIGMGLNWLASAGTVVQVAPNTELVIGGAETIATGNLNMLGGGRIRVTGTHTQTVNP